MGASRDQVARALNISPRRVNQLCLEGMPRLATGAYNTGACLVWYSRYLLRALAREASPAALAEDDSAARKELRNLGSEKEQIVAERRHLAAAIAGVENIIAQLQTQLAFAQKL